MACDSCGAKRGHMPGCDDPAASPGGKKEKRKYTRRGPVCPECGATMDVNPKNPGQAHCPFASSHNTSRAVRNAGAARAGERNRGRVQPPEEKARSQRAAARGRAIWRSRKDPKDGGKASGS